MATDNLPAPPTSDSASLRRTAEARVKAKPATRQPRGTIRQRQIQHELEVHQIELEMQNEELRAARTGLDAALDRYTELFEFAPVGYFNLAADGAIQLVNHAGAKLVGLERSRLTGRRLGLLVAEVDRPAFADFLVRTFATEATQNCEVTLAGKGRPLRIVRCEATRSADGQQCHAALIDLTEQKTAERDQRESEERFRLMVESVTDYAIFMLDPEGRVVTWNPGAERIKGYPAEEIIGRHFARFYPQADVDCNKPERALALAAAQGRWADEGWRVRMDGSRFWAYVVITALRDDTGRLRGFAKITRDLTERRRAEAALHESELQLQTMLDHSPALIFVKDPDGRYLRVNRRFEVEFGLTREAVLGRTDRELFPRAQAEAFRANDAAVLQAGVPRQFEEVARYADGEHVSLVSKFPLLDSAGKVRALCGIAIDVTERKQMENALRRANLTLQSIFDAAPVAVLSLDLAGRVTHWSAGAERLFGWPAVEAVGQILPTVPPDGREDFHAMLARVVRNGPETGLVRCRQKRSGELIHASLCPAPLRDAGGQVVGVMVTLEDVTGRVRAQEALQQHSEQLAQLSRQLFQAQEVERRRIAGELHDQVGQMLVFLQLKIRAAQAGTGPATVPQLLEESATLIEELHEQVRGLSLELRPAVLDDLGLVPALRWHLDQLGRCGAPAVRFTAGKDVPRLPGDVETVCFRVAQEALTNALRHARARAIAVTLAVVGRELVMELSDDGIGFDPQHARLRAAQGDSLGIIGMEERLKPVGGKICFESSARGTLVRVTLPLPEGLLATP